MARLLPALVLLLALAAPAAAQQQQGDVELQFTGSFQSTIGAGETSTTTALALAKVGYFVTDRLQLGAYPGLTLVRVTVESAFGTFTDSDANVGLGLFGVYSYLSEDATTVPYLGAQFYQSDLGEARLENAWMGVNGGLKFFVNRYTALDLGGNVLIALDTPERQLLLLQVGLSFLL